MSKAAIASVEPDSSGTVADLNIRRPIPRHSRKSIFVAQSIVSNGRKLLFFFDNSLSAPSAAAASDPLAGVAAMRRRQILQRLERADDDGFALQRDPAQARPVAQLLVGGLA